MSIHFADRLTQACRVKKTALCVGLDPRLEQVPVEIIRRHGNESFDAMAGAVEEFCLRVLEIVAPLVAVIKPQSAFFEAYGPPGMRALQNVLTRARALGLVTILDSKRSDIASTAQAYADAVFGDSAVWPADAMTINPYLGRDSVETFLTAARRVGGGLFALVRTSNPGAKQFQDLVCEGSPLYQHVAKAVAGWATQNLGEGGLGDIGAVVGATHPSELALLRKMLPNVLFLIPGYGAQGGTAADVGAGFRADGTGAIVNSSRGITACFPPEEKDWEAAIDGATRKAIAELPVNGVAGRIGA